MISRRLKDLNVHINREMLLCRLCFVVSVALLWINAARSSEPGPDTLPMRLEVELALLEEALKARVKDDEALNAKLDAVGRHVAGLNFVRVPEDSEPGRRLRRLRNQCTQYADLVYNHETENQDRAAIIEKTFAILVAVKGLKHVTDTPEWMSLCKGFSDPSAKVRQETFEQALKGSGTRRALLHICLNMRQETPDHWLTLSRSAARPGEKIGFRYGMRVRGEGAWLPVGQRRPLVNFDPAGQSIELYGSAKKKAEEEINQAALGLGGGRQRHPLSRFRIYRKTDPQADWRGAYTPRRCGVVRIRWPGAIHVNRLRVPPEFLPEGEKRVWTLTPCALDGGTGIAVPVLPAPETCGRAHQGLKLSAFLPSAKAEAMLHSHKPAMASRTLLVELEVIDRDPHRVIDIAKHPGKGFWMFLMDEAGRFAGMANSTGGRIAADSRKLQFVTLKKGKKESLRSTCVLPPTLKPGRYTAYVGFGPIIHSKSAPPPDTYWSGELVAKPVEFEVQEAEKQPLRPPANPKRPSATP